jgi:hypothetical protein
LRTNVNGLKDPSRLRLKRHARLGAVVENLENRRLFHAVVPAGYVALETVQIRPSATATTTAAATLYTTDLTLTSGTTYFLEATGYTRSAANVFHGDAAFMAGTATTPAASSSSWGITATVGSDTTATSDWGPIQGDNIYGQTFAPTASGALSFTFNDDGLDKISTLAVTVYGVAPTIKVGTIRTDVVTGSVPIASLPAGKVFIPLNNVDWDHNGVADDKQSGAVPGDKFLVPIRLPAIPSAGAGHIVITAPHGLRVWLNPDRTGSTVGVGLSASVARRVYVEAYAQQSGDAAADLQIALPFDGVTVKEEIPVVAFALGGAATATGGVNEVYSSDAPTGRWLLADGGTLDTGTTAVVKNVDYANVVWNDSNETGYVDFEADDDFIWGLPVEVTG